MHTALDLDPSAFNDYELRVVKAVREHGWFCPSVFSQDGNEPGFSYSVGIWKTLGQPEIIVFGLPAQVSHGVLWDLYRRFEQGFAPEVGEPIDELLEGYPAYLMPAGRKADEHMLSTNWFYDGEAYPRLQLVWPDMEGVFPWEPNFDPKFANDQPDLSDEGWMALSRPL